MLRHHPFRVALAAVLTLVASAAFAQAPASQLRAQGAAGAAASDDDARPATTTFLGDTGIWYVPTAEVLSKGTWSGSIYRRGTNYVQGDSNVGDFAGTVGFGVSDRIEVFGSWLLDTRINRDATPTFANDARAGGVIDRYPRVSEHWTDDRLGDLNLGLKLNLLSETRGAPAAVAVRGIVKVPTGNEDAGVSTGKADVMVDLIASTELARMFEVAAYVGYEHRGEPSGFESAGGAYRWGTGVSFPSRSPLRLSAEANGDLPSDYRLSLTDHSLVGADGSLPPFESDIRNRTRATAGLTYQTRSGVFVGTGLSWNAPRHWDWQFRIGYHGPTRNQARPIVVALPDPEPVAVVLTPAPVAPPPPPPPAPPAAVAAPVQAPVAAARVYSFDDIYFDFDRFVPQAASMPVLNEATEALLADPSLTVVIQGYTCYIGTAEYNIALGERRAANVQAYFISRGIAAGRMRTVSFGEENPKHDNAQEETRRLNRRVALVMSLR